MMLICLEGLVTELEHTLQHLGHRLNLVNRIREGQRLSISNLYIYYIYMCIYVCSIHIHILHNIMFSLFLMFENDYILVV